MGGISLGSDLGVMLAMIAVGRTYKPITKERAELMGHQPGGISSRVRKLPLTSKVRGAKSGGRRQGVGGMGASILRLDAIQ